MMLDDMNPVVDAEEAMDTDGAEFDAAVFAAEDTGAGSDSNSELNKKLREHFDGKIVRKDLTRSC